MKKIISILVIMVLVTIVLSIHHANASELYLPLRDFSHGSGDGQFKGGSASIKIDSARNIYMADNGNYRIQKFSPDGKFITKWGTQGTGQGQFSGISGICIDSSNNVYVIDPYNQKEIQKFSNDGTYISSLNLRLDLLSPENCAIDSSGNLYLASAYSVIKYSPTGEPSNWAGHQGSATPTPSDQFQNPNNIVIDSSGNIFIADTANYRIQEYAANQTFVKTIGSQGSGDGQFTNPFGLTVDSTGNIYVVDNANGKIQKFSPDGKFITKWISADIIGGNGIAVDSSDNVYAGIHVFAHRYTPIANNQTIIATQNNGTNFILTGFVDSTQTQTYSIVTQPLHGILSGIPPNLSYTPTLNFFGSDSFTFKIHEGTRDSNVATVPITVNAGKYPPQVNAGLTQTISSGSLVTLDGSKSYDIDGDKLTYSWLQTAGTPVTLSDKTSFQPIFTAPTVNTDMILTFVLTVNDGTSSNSTSITVTIKPSSSSQSIQNTTPPMQPNTLQQSSVSINQTINTQQTNQNQISQSVSPNKISTTSITPQPSTINQVNDTNGKSIQDIISERIATANKLKQLIDQSGQQTTS